MRKVEHHFLRTERCGRYFILAALPGQTLGRKNVSEGIAVKGCDKYRKSFPPGSLFATTTLRRAHHGCAWFYKVDDLYFIGGADPFSTSESEPLRQTLIAEYREFSLSETKIPENQQPKQ